MSAPGRSTTGGDSAVVDELQFRRLIYATSNLIKLNAQSGIITCVDLIVNNINLVAALQQLADDFEYITENYVSNDHLDDVLADYVKLSGDQTIEGVKTFDSSPVVPDGSWSIAKTLGLQTALDNLLDYIYFVDTTAVKTVYDSTVTAVTTFMQPPVVPDSSWTIAKTSGLQAALDSKATNADVMHLSGNETANGVKTFNSPPVVPNSSWTIAKTANLQTQLDTKANNAAVVHNHSNEDINGNKTFFNKIIAKYEPIECGEYPLYTPAGSYSVEFRPLAAKGTFAGDGSVWANVNVVSVTRYGTGQYGIVLNANATSVGTSFVASSYADMTQVCTGDVLGLPYTYVIRTKKIADFFLSGVPTWSYIDVTCHFILF